MSGQTSVRVSTRQVIMALTSHLLHTFFSLSSHFLLTSFSLTLIRHPCNTLFSPSVHHPLLTIHASPASHHPCNTLFSPSLHHPHLLPTYISLTSHSGEHGMVTLGGGDNGTTYQVRIGGKHAQGGLDTRLSSLLGAHLSAILYADFSHTHDDVHKLLVTTPSLANFDIDHPFDKVTNTYLYSHLLSLSFVLIDCYLGVSSPFVTSVLTPPVSTHSSHTQSPHLANCVPVFSLPHDHPLFSPLVTNFYSRL